MTLHTSNDLLQRTPGRSAVDTFLQVGAYADANASAPEMTPDTDFPGLRATDTTDTVDTLDEEAAACGLLRALSPLPDAIPGTFPVIPPVIPPAIAPDDRTTWRSPLGSASDVTASSDSSEGGSVPFEVLTLAEIAVILQGTQDRLTSDDVTNGLAAQRVQGLVVRVKECTRCAPHAERPPEGTTSTLCPRHLILEFLQLFQRAAVRSAASSHPSYLSHPSPAADSARDPERLGRILRAVALSDRWPVEDWALAARTLDDATASVALLRAAPVIHHAMVLCEAAAAGRGTADGAL